MEVMEAGGFPMVLLLEGSSPILESFEASDDEPA